jgi:hypothetical protein
MAFSSVGRTVKDGLVLYYAFEKSSGDKVIDKSGTGNDGTIKGTLKQVDGKYGSALLFDFNAANYIDAGKPPFDGLIDGGTIEAWVKPASLPRVISVIRKDHDFNIFLWGPHVKGEWFKEGNIYPCEGTTTLEIDKWYHISATWDGKTINVYLDGELEKSSSTGSAFNRTGPHPLYIGLAPVYTEPMDGVIDEVAIYDRPLTAQELQQDMKGVAAGVFPSGKLTTAWGHLKSQ